MRTFVALSCFVVLSGSTLFAQNDWRSGIQWAEPKVVTSGTEPGAPPSDAIILFDGKNMDAWTQDQWTVADGVVTVKPGSGDAQTKEKFGSIQLHLEFATPEKVEGSSQGRGNSGLFLMGHYEVQILDNYENATYVDGMCGGIYKQRPPFVNACRKPGEWQTYDVFFTRPIFRVVDGKLAEVVRPASITVVQNGVLVVNNHAIEGDTSYHIPPAYTLHGDKEPIRLQDHGNLTKFRNIWVREIPDSNAKPPRGKEFYADDRTIDNLKREIEKLKKELDDAKE